MPTTTSPRFRAHTRHGRRKALQRPAVGVHAARRHHLPGAGRTRSSRAWPISGARRGPLSEDGRPQFRGAIEDMTESWLWELANQIQNRVPDPVDYIEMRRKTFGSDLTMSLSQLERAERCRPRSTGTRPMRALENSAVGLRRAINDIFSYQKEIEFEGELNNGVLVVQHFLGCDRAQGAGRRDRQRPDDRAHAAVRARRGHRAPGLFDEFDLDEGARGPSKAMSKSFRCGCPAS